MVTPTLVQARLVACNGPTLFNLDALLELVLGLVLLFNPLLGPVLRRPGWLIALFAETLLVGACVLGRAGMGKGSLQQRLAQLGIITS